MAFADRAKYGAVRVEYVVAGVVCTALLTGMTAVLYVRSGARSMRSAPIVAASPGAPIARVTPSQTPRPPSPTLPRTESPSPRTPSPAVVVEVPHVTETPRRVEIPAAPRVGDTSAQQRPVGVPKTVESSTPTVVVIPAGGQSQSTGATGASRAYPSGVPPVLTKKSPLRIEAENYDTGGEGVSYHDTTSQNEGHGYRSGEGVDVDEAKDSEGGAQAIVGVRSGEWWNYSIRVQDTGEYRLKIRAARAAWGDAKARLRVDGFDKTGEIAIPSTGGFAAYRTIDAGPVQLGSSGVKVLRLEALTGEWNVNWIELSPGGSGPAPVVAARATPSAAVPVVVQIGGGSGTTTPPKSSPQPQPAAGNMAVVVDDDFAADKINNRPSGDRWSFGGTGGITVQSVDGTLRCLRLVDSSNKGETWARRSFAAMKEHIVWTGKIRFAPSAEGVGVSLMDNDKPAAISYIKDGQFGIEGPGGYWSALKEARANTWYDLKIDVDLKRKVVVYEFDGAKKSLRLVTKDLPQVNAWALMGGGQTVGTVYVSSIKIEAK